MIRNLHISTKLLLTILPLGFLAIGISVYVNNYFQEREMLNQAQLTAQIYGDIIRESLVEMMTTRQQIDDEYLKRLNSMQDIHDLGILFKVENLHLRDVYQNEERLARLQRREQTLLPFTEEERNIFQTMEPVLRRDGQTIVALIPFKAVAKCQKCHDVPVGHVLGVARMNISLERVSSSIRDNWIRSFWVYLGFSLLAIVFSIYVYRALVAKRLKALINAAHVIGGGNLEQPVAITSSNDELGELATAFDTMRIRLKGAQEQLIHSERLSTIGQMASSIIHDFRSPMSTINLAVQSLEQKKELTPQKTAHWYRLIRDAINRMVTMAQELLDFSKGELHLQKTEFSIDEFMRLFNQSVKPNLEKAKIELILKQQCGGTAIFDADRLHRALVNIVNNAQDAMPNGGSLHITTKRENGSIYFSIADTGIGIPPEIREKIFDAFFTSGKKRGTGLGLAITKRIIDQHRGTIEVQSDLGKGTTFIVKIPAT